MAQESTKVEAELAARTAAAEEVEAAAAAEAVAETVNTNAALTTIFKRVPLLLVFKCLNGQPLEYIALNVILRETEPIYGA